MTRNLRVLERRGLLAIGADSRDGRVRRAFLTPAGRDRLLKASDQRRTVTHATKTRIPAAAPPTLWDAFERIAEQ